MPWKWSALWLVLASSFPRSEPLLFSPPTLFSSAMPAMLKISEISTLVQCTQVRASSSGKSRLRLAPQSSFDDIAKMPEGLHLKDGDCIHIRAADEQGRSAAMSLLEESVLNGSSLPYLTFSEASDSLQTHFCMIAADAENQTLGCFWLGPAFPGRSRHLGALTLITASNHRRRGVASLMAVAAMRMCPDLGFDALFAPLVFVSDAASVSLCRSLHFKLLSLLPRAGHLANGCRSTDAMQFWYSMDRPATPAPNLAWLQPWHPAYEPNRHPSTRKRGHARSGTVRGAAQREGATGGRGRGQPGAIEKEEAEQEAREHRRWMGEALARADKAEQLGEVPVGAVVVQGGRVIGEGWNRAISGNDPCGHAEVSAIQDACRAVGNYRLSGATLYVTLEPCVMCAGALLHARVGTVVFAARDLKAGAAGTVWDIFASPSTYHAVKVVSGVLEKECSERLAAFFASRRRRRD